MKDGFYIREASDDVEQGTVKQKTRKERKMDEFNQRKLK